MPTVGAWSLWLHIVAGTVAVLAGFGALVTTKGGWRHRQAGKLFLVAMAVVVMTVLVLAGLDPTQFRVVLTLVAVFSGYLAFSGYRVIARKRSASSAGLVDWSAAGTVILACLVLGGWGLTRLLDGGTFGIVLAVFGAIGIGFGLMDVRSFRGGGSANWMVSHLQRMGGAFIATVSAVSAVNLTPVLGIGAWLLPNVLGVPLIAYWSKEYGSD